MGNSISYSLGEEKCYKGVEVNLGLVLKTELKTVVKLSLLKCAKEAFHYDLHLNLWQGIF